MISSAGQDLRGGRRSLPHRTWCSGPLVHLQSAQLGGGGDLKVGEGQRGLEWYGADGSTQKPEAVTTGNSTSRWIARCGLGITETIQFGVTIRESDAECASVLEVPEHDMRPSSARARGRWRKSPSGPTA
ncbi:hypothetical protein EHS25_001805 [Saitozyma podzolica]|uniref:Uncharacterized protein n=1 Tax=Saitozyma podzolica TaxID=1890683 RepID=A0A427YF56_9TREE|nr:hypothetical protein EHS25_001805 [Saitozyma podzolica]